MDLGAAIAELGEWLNGVLASAWAPVIAFALGGMFTAAISEWRTRAAEKRQEFRQRQQWSREDELASKARVRDALLRDLDETRKGAMAELNYWTHRGDGIALPHPRGDYPYADDWLIGDVSIPLEKAAVVGELQKRKPGTGIPQELLLRLSTVHVRTLRALKEQEARVLAGEPLRGVDTADAGMPAEHVRAELTRLMDDLLEQHSPAAGGTGVVGGLPPGAAESRTRRRRQP